MVLLGSLGNAVAREKTQFCSHLVVSLSFAAFSMKMPLSPVGGHIALEGYSVFCKDLIGTVSPWSQRDI